MIGQFEDIFVSVTKEISEQLKLELKKPGLRVIGKGEKKSLLIMRTLAVRSEQAGNFLFATDHRDIVSQNVTFTFLSAGEKYIFKAFIDVKRDGQILVFPKSEFFRIQRRSDFRMRLPDSYHSILKLTFVNNLKVKLFSKVNDISAGGVGLTFRSAEPSFNKGDVIKGELHFSRRPILDIVGTVKHIRNSKDGSQPLQILGLQFEEGNKDLEKKIRAVSMEIYRELFSSIK